MKKMKALYIILFTSVHIHKNMSRIQYEQVNDQIN